MSYTTQQLMEGVVEVINTLPEPELRREVVARLKEVLPRVRWLTDQAGKVVGIE